MTEQTNTPELRFPEFNEEWREFNLKDISTKKSKKNKNKLYNETFTNSAEYGIVPQKDYFDKEISNVRNLSNYYIVDPDDFVYNPRISSLAPVGPINRNKLNRIGVMSPLYTVFSTKLSSKSFLEYYFKTTKWHKFMKLNGDSGARSDRFTIKQSLFVKMPIVLPSEQEQEKIGGFFSKLDRQIELEEEKLELLEQQKRGYMQKLFSQELRFKDKNGNQYPEWVIKKLGDIGKVAMNKRIYKNETTENGEIPFYKIGNFGKNADTFITREKFDEYKEKYPYPNVGDILISASGSIGRTIEYTGEDAYYQDSNIVWLNHNDEVINKYLKYFYKIVKWSGIEGTTIKRLYNKNILNTKIELPTVEEQYKMANFLSKLDKIIDIQIEKIELLKQRKQGLLQKMFI